MKLRSPYKPLSRSTCPPSTRWFWKLFGFMFIDQPTSQLEYRGKSIPDFFAAYEEMEWTRKYHEAQAEMVRRWIAETRA